MRRKRWVVAVAFLLVLLSAMLSACGDEDPYSGTWTAPGDLKLVIAKANDGWWSIDGGTEDMPNIFSAAEIDGELQAANGSNTFRRVGDVLEVTLAPGASVTAFSKE